MKPYHFERRRDGRHCNEVTWERLQRRIEIAEREGERDCRERERESLGWRDETCNPLFIEAYQWWLLVW